METKHTPGLWTAERMLITPATKDRRSGFVVNGPEPEDQTFPPRICDLRVPAGVGGFAEGEANAHLIAAAPELLEALQYALGDLETPGSPLTAGGRQDRITMYRAAIARAKGQQPT